MNRPDRSFSPLLFRLYASDLSEAVFKMSVESINAALRDQPLSVEPQPETIPADIPAEPTEVPVSPFVSQEKPKSMSTIGEQLKAARAKLAEVRQGAADAIVESDHAAGAVLAEVNKVLKEASDLRAEVAELTNGGPPLEQ
jgi:hypothetical protein